ncbi:MAG: hemolysin III family protein [Proteobacteria bacterium]|nr:hemolysin III family protein [Pseudomonadota bacterium]MDA1324687.1 hemolysin III family protein [Pseudomonadota bacterium]
MSVERYPRAEERMNAATHGLGAVLSAIGLVFLLIEAQSVGRAGSVPAVVVYGLSLLLLFLSSALHHAVLRPKFKHFLLAIDHCGIYFLIAGTYTPFCLLMPAGREWELLALVWVVAIVGIVVQLASFLTGRSDGYERIAFVFYLALGWLPILWVGDDIYRNLELAGLMLLFAGGVAFSIGVVFYLWKRLPYGHAVWHLFVVAGCAFHFFAIFHYVVPMAS